MSLHVGNVGYHLAAVAEKDPASLITWAKVLVITPAIYAIACALPKLSILAIYLRIFPQKSFRTACYIVGAIVIAVAIADVVAGVTLCTPLAYLWDKSVPGGHCINIVAFYRYGPMPNAFTDLAMLLLPIPLIWDLHTSRHIKVGVTLSFLTGSMYVLGGPIEFLCSSNANECVGSGLITSIIRCVEFFLNNPLEDGTWASVTFLVWSIVEPGVYLIAACLLCFRHLFNYIKTGDPHSSGRSRFSRSRKSQAHSGPHNDQSIRLEPRLTAKTIARYQRHGSDDEEILVGRGIDPNMVSGTKGRTAIGKHGI